MDLHGTDDDLVFRDRVRAFLEAALPPELRRKMHDRLRLGKDDYVRWHRILARRAGWRRAGLSTAAVPAGQPCSATSSRTNARAPARRRILPLGISMVAPVIMAFGSQAQKDYYLPRILSCEDWWCQAYSEPGVGSDLDGITLFALPADAPGLQLTEYRTLDGLRAADLRLDGVQLAAGAVIGTVGAGWTILEAVADYGAGLLCAEAGGGDGRAVRGHARLSQDAPAVRGLDRHVPGAAAPHGRHGHPSRAGPLAGAAGGGAARRR